MTSGFGDAAARLYGIAASLLGWRPDEFWSATPVEVAMALAPPEAAADPIEAERITELRRRFPD